MHALAVLPVRSDVQLIQSIDRLSPHCAVVLSLGGLAAESLRIAETVRSIDHMCPLLVLTPTVSSEGAVAAMRIGISDILAANASGKDIICALTHLARRWGRGRGQGGPGELIGGSRMVGAGAAISRIRSQIAKVAPTDANVLITGESGTGKELVAELIHRNSPRSQAPFVAVNCAAVPDALLESELFGHERGAFTGAAAAREGKLQFASGGTLFLDEVGDMSLMSQAKILRAVESRVVQRLGSNVDTPVKARLVTATSQNLELLTREKKFREDLYFRINVVRLALPPLRERLEDIPDLTEHILRELTERHRATPRRIEGDVVRRFQRYEWPGNIRQLRNVLETILVFSSSRSIGLSDVPSEICETLGSSPAHLNHERSKIIGALSSANWNRNKAAQILCCSRMTLYRRMVKLSIPARGL